MVGQPKRWKVFRHKIKWKEGKNGSGEEKRWDLLVRGIER